MNIFKKLFQNIRKESFKQYKTTTKNIPIHQTFENLNISNELLKNNATQSEFLDHIKEKKLFFTQDCFSFKINAIKNILDKCQKNYPNYFLDIIEDTFTPIYQGQYVAIKKIKTLILIKKLI